MDNHALFPHNKLPAANTVTILLVGEQGTGKHSLAKSIVDTKTTFSVQVRTATSLPLAPDNEGTRPRIDFVVFLVDLTNTKSMTLVSKCAAELDVHYYLSKCCFVACNVSDGENQTIEIEGITQLANNYQSHLFTANLDDTSSRQVLAAHILQMAAPCGATGCPPLLVGATQSFSQTYAL